MKTALLPWRGRGLCCLGSSLWCSWLELFCILVEDKIHGLATWTTTPTPDISCSDDFSLTLWDIWCNVTLIINPKSFVHRSKDLPRCRVCCLKCWVIGQHALDDNTTPAMEMFSTSNPRYFLCFFYLLFWYVHLLRSFELFVSSHVMTFLSWTRSAEHKPHIYC